MAEAVVVLDASAVLAVLLDEAGAARQAGLSLGDRACLALAKRLGLPALTADRAWLAAGARLGVRVELIR